MPVDMAVLVGDVAAETAVTRGLVADLSETGWRTPTPAPGWDIADQIGHLAYFDQVAVLAAVDPKRFRAELTAMQATDTDAEATAAGYRDRSGVQILAWFDQARTGLLATFKDLDPAARLPWFGPAMSAASSLTARLMETWAHTQDVADALGISVDRVSVKGKTNEGVGALGRGEAIAVHAIALLRSR